jgi:hypothetical protein
MTHEDRQRLIHAPFPAIRVLPGKSHSGNCHTEDHDTAYHRYLGALRHAPSVDDGYLPTAPTFARHKGRGRG